MAEPVKLLRVPERVYSLDELLGLVNHLNQAGEMEDIVILINDGTGGVTSVTINGTSCERVNWMLDRAKRLLHWDED